ncbi:glutathione S-transferase family protein [Pseudoduganella sp. UC29_106]|uniref:glutathione S-transferase family protein n=1 Tax=Pseudoduganella sp. UC29_106 TaxID=3374553 RepID=UPI00375653B0
MVPILYYGAPHSCSFGAIFALEWLCRPYHLLRLELPGQHGPMLETRRHVMRDCHTILRDIGSQRRYLLGYRPGSADHLRLERLLDTLHEEFQAGAPRLFAFCAQLDAHFDSHEWVAGDKRTVADAYLVAAARWAERHARLDVSRYRRLQHYLNELHQDPAVLFADAIESNRPSVSSGRFQGHLRLEEVDQPLAA